MNERVAIVGARHHPDLDSVRRYVATLAPGTIVISGGAEGVDTAAAHEARRLGFEVREFFAHHPSDLIGYEVSYRDLLIARNTLIALACTRMIAFVKGSRGGTWDAIRQAQRFRRPLEVVE